MRRMRHCKIILIIIVSLIIVSGCKSKDEIEINARVYEYYSLEMKKKWGDAYELRPPSYRRNIDKNDYIENMSKDSYGWELIDYKIVNINFISDDHALVLMEFIQDVPANFIVPSAGNVLVFREPTFWIKINDYWYVSDAGLRMHLPYNKNMAR